MKMKNTTDFLRDIRKKKIKNLNISFFRNFESYHFSWLFFSIQSFSMMTIPTYDTQSFSFIRPSQLCKLQQFFSNRSAIIQSPPFWAAAPKGPMTYAFTQGKFFLLLQRTPPLASSLRAQILPDLCFHICRNFSFSSFSFFFVPPPRGPIPSLEAQIPALRLKSQP